MRSCSKCPRRRVVWPPLVNGFDNCGCFACTTTRSPSAPLSALRPETRAGATHLERWRSRCRWPEPEPKVLRSESQSDPELAAKNAADEPWPRSHGATKCPEGEKKIGELKSRESTDPHVNPPRLPLAVHRRPLDCQSSETLVEIPIARLVAETSDYFIYYHNLSFFFGNFSQSLFIMGSTVLPYMETKPKVIFFTDFDGTITVDDSERSHSKIGQTDD